MFTCIISCRSNEKNENDTSLFHIKIEKPDISSLQPLRLSEFADSIEYLQLETNDDCLLPFYGTSSMFRVDNSLFLGDIHSILRFDAITGKFICQIGSRGQGPKEYIQIQDVRAAKDNNRIVVKPGYKQDMLTYSYDGKYLEHLIIEDIEGLPYSTCYYSLHLMDIDSQYMILLPRLCRLNTHVSHMR